ncbi:MAG: Jag family protein [bacterium]
MAENQKIPDSGGGIANPEMTESAAMERITQVVQALIGYLGVRAGVEVSRDAHGYLVNIKTKRASAILIGPRGSTLKALQHLVRTIVRRTFPDVAPILVDVAGYRQRRDNFLCKKALAVAKIVTDTNREMALDFLTEKEMAVVLEALKNISSVRVYAVGTGPRRNVVIAPVDTGPRTS